MTEQATTQVRSIIDSAAFTIAGATLAAQHDRTVADIIALTETPAPPFKERDRAQKWSKSPTWKDLRRPRSLAQVRNSHALPTRRFTVDGANDIPRSLQRTVRLVGLVCVQDLPVIQGAPIEVVYFKVGEKVLKVLAHREQGILARYSHLRCWFAVSVVRMPIDKRTLAQEAVDLVSVERFQPDWNCCHAKIGGSNRPPVRFMRLRLHRPEEEMLWQRGRAYSQDLRERVLAAADDGEPVGRIATLLRVSVSYVSKVLSRRQRTGQTTALPQRCHLPRRLAALQGAIEAQVTSHPDATIAELRAWLAETHKVSASTGLMWKTLAALDLTVKKSRSALPSRTVRTLPKRVPNGVPSSRL